MLRALVIAALPTIALAAPTELPVQARILDAAGGPLNGTYTVRVSLWSGDNPADPITAVFSEQLTEVGIEDGYLSASLGADDTLDSEILSQDLWVSFAIDGASEMLPRQRVGTSPKAATLDGVSPGDIQTLTNGSNADLLHTHEQIVFESGKPWFQCGDLGDLAEGTDCQIDEYPGLEYEYGFIYNSRTPLPAVCTYWNRGQRFYNRDPYFVSADNPSNNIGYGGAMWYTGTDATDDDTCNGDRWMHKYWRLSNGTVSPYASNGCFSLPVYCRKR
jgi:hypothetical protein